MPMSTGPKLVKANEVPTMERVHGLFLQWRVTKDKDGADEVLMGIIRLETDSADPVWDGRLDEIFYCVSGKLKAVHDDGKGSKGELAASPNEALFLPRGHHYVMRATGLETLTIFCKKA